MIMNWAGYFLLGLIWDLLIAINTRLIADKKPKYLFIFISSCFVMLIWGFMIQSLTVDKTLIFPYSLACGLGSVAGVFLHKNLKSSKPLPPKPLKVKDKLVKPSQKIKKGGKNVRKKQIK